MGEISTINESHKKPLNKVHLQLIAALAMLIDHITWVVFPGYPAEALPIILHILVTVFLMTPVLP